MKVTRTKSFLNDTRGAGMVEYIILVGVVAILAIAGFKAFGGQISGKIQQQGGTVNAVP